MKCNDCGATDYTPSSRSDLCEPCFKLRMDLLAAVKTGAVCMDEFRQLQQVLSRGSGQGAAAIRRTLGLTAPEI